MTLIPQRNEIQRRKRTDWQRKLLVVQNLIFPEPQSLDHDLQMRPVLNINKDKSPFLTPPFCRLFASACSFCDVLFACLFP